MYVTGRPSLQHVQAGHRADTRCCFASIPGKGSRHPVKKNRKNKRTRWIGNQQYSLFRVQPQPKPWDAYGRLGQVTASGTFTNRPRCTTTLGMYHGNPPNGVTPVFYRGVAGNKGAGAVCHRGELKIFASHRVFVATGSTLERARTREAPTGCRRGKTRDDHLRTKCQKKMLSELWRCEHVHHHFDTFQDTRGVSCRQLTHIEHPHPADSSNAHARNCEVGGGLKGAFKAPDPTKTVGPSPFLKSNDTSSKRYHEQLRRRTIPLSRGEGEGRHVLAITSRNSAARPGEMRAISDPPSQCKEPSAFRHREFLRTLDRRRPHFRV